MEKTVTADLIEIGCTFTPVIIMAIYGILNKDRDVKHPFMALLIWIFAIGLPLGQSHTISTHQPKLKNLY